MIAFFSVEFTYSRKKKSFCNGLVEIKPGKEEVDQAIISLLFPPLPHHCAKKAFSLNRAIVGFKESKGSTNNLLPMDFLFHFWTLWSKGGIFHGGKGFLNPEALWPLNKSRVDEARGQAYHVWWWVCWWYDKACLGGAKFCFFEGIGILFEHVATFLAQKSKLWCLEACWIIAEQWGKTELFGGRREWNPVQKWLWLFWFLWNPWSLWCFWKHVVFWKLDRLFWFQLWFLWDFWRLEEFLWRAHLLWNL